MNEGLSEHPLRSVQSIDGCRILPGSLVRHLHDAGSSGLCVSVSATAATIMWSCRPNPQTSNFTKDLAQTTYDKIRHEDEHRLYSSFQQSDRWAATSYEVAERYNDLPYDEIDRLKREIDTVKVHIVHDGTVVVKRRIRSPEDINFDPRIQHRELTIRN